jgi:hypothetical protein
MFTTASCPEPPGDGWPLGAPLAPPLGAADPGALLAPPLGAADPGAVLAPPLGAADPGAPEPDAAGAGVFEGAGAYVQPAVACEQAVTRSTDTAASDR